MKAIPTQGELYRRIKHAQGLKYQSEGNHKEARICFEAVWKNAKREAKS